MRILYIGRVQLPNKDAASLRVYNIGYVLKKSGHTVDYLCTENQADEPIVWEDSTYYFVFSKAASGLEKNREWLFGNGVMTRLRELCRANRYDAVILYNSTYSIEKKVLQYCRQEHISVLSDVTEWYAVRFPTNVNALFSTLHAIAVDWRIRKADQKLDGVIAISKYLCDYYQKKGVKTLRIPPVFHDDRLYEDPSGECKTILYAGRPAKKDEIQILIDAVQAVNRDQIILQMVFVGTGKPDNAEALEKKGIYFRPRCDHAQVIEYVRSSDFTVLFRRNQRFAKAGYSTKVAESLYNGVPVFCNDIGGTDADIEDGFNGVKIKTLNLEDMVNGLKRIAGMDREECARMRRDCRTFGDQMYDADRYVERIDAFLTQISAK